MRTQVDRITGQLSDTRTRFLGTRPPKLFAANVKSQRSMLSLSSRPWLGYSDMGRYNLTPLSYEALDYASGTSKLSALLYVSLPLDIAALTFAHASCAKVQVVQLCTCWLSQLPCAEMPQTFSFEEAQKLAALRTCSVGCAGFASEQCPEGFVAVAKNTLRILTLERLGETFNQQSCPLRYTPRKFVIHPEHKVCPLHAIHMAAMSAAACALHNRITSWLLMAPSCSKLYVSSFNASVDACFGCQLRSLLLTVMVLSACLMVISWGCCFSQW